MSRAGAAAGRTDSVDRLQLRIPIIHWGYDLSVNGLTAKGGRGEEGCSVRPGYGQR